MKLIRYERPELGSFPGRLEDWFRTNDSPLSLRNLSSLFDGLSPSGGTNGQAFGADLYEDDKAYYARFELAGVKKKRIKVELHNSVLTVSYTRSKKSEEDGKSDASYTRSMSVPDGVDADRIAAEHRDGLLTVTLPKSEATKPKAISVH